MQLYQSWDSIIFKIIPIVIAMIFAAILGILFVRILKSFSQWNKNNQCPIQQIKATVVEKRVHQRHQMKFQSKIETSHTTSTYHVLFETENKEQLEFIVSSKEYKLLVQGYFGILTAQGTRE
ncbi:MAG: DUF2500 domain-containing protein [Oscillospiraceae bacterium]